MRTLGICFLNQVTIVPKGNSVGETTYVPWKRWRRTRAEILARLDVDMGGRAAEELVFGSEQITGGASSDLQVRNQKLFPWL